MNLINLRLFVIFFFATSPSLAQTAKTQAADSALPIRISLGMAIDTSDVFPEPFELAKEPFTTQPEAIHRVLPQYPPLAMRAGRSGTISLRLGLRPNGTVKVAYIIETSDEVFHESALRAAMQWKFKPPRVGDKAYPVWIVVGFKFSSDLQRLKYTVDVSTCHVE